MNPVIEAARAILEHEYRIAAQGMKGFPRNEIGLTPDEVKGTANYRRARMQFQASFQSLREFNSRNTPQSRSRG